MNTERNEGPVRRNSSVLRCYVCGGVGHKQSDCPTARNSRQSSYSHYSTTTHSYGRPRGVSMRRAVEASAPCYVCGKTGHQAKDCWFRYRGEELRKKENNETEKPAEKKHDVICANCLQYGHIASECKNERVCSRCGEPGHVRKDCCNAVLCRRCFQKGHFAKDCQNPPLCLKCKQTG
ncbi:hypothetical protein WA556_003727, partial [Blastocystis sp. ATCC 50177/Nand II]